MNESMIKKVNTIVFIGVKHENTLADLSKRISKKMSEAFTGNWQCFAFSHFGSSFVINKGEKYIWFNIEDLSIIIYQSSS